MRVSKLRLDGSILVEFGNWLGERGRARRSPQIGEGGGRGTIREGGNNTAGSRERRKGTVETGEGRILTRGDAFTKAGNDGLGDTVKWGD